MTSKMFVRILARHEVNGVIDMMNRDLGRRFPRLRAGDLMHEIKAPDGETVLAAAEIRPGIYAVRLHREVFSPK